MLTTALGVTRVNMRVRVCRKESLPSLHSCETTLVSMGAHSVSSRLCNSEQW